jgi:hypothetical protein
MPKRLFASEPGQIRFTEDFREQTRGSLLPGSSITVEFADVRIPDEPSGLARVEACIEFDTDATQRLELRLRTAWRDINPALTEPGEGNQWLGTFTPPANSREFRIWFEKTGPSGTRYYDSKFGKNYWFRFTSIDIGEPEAQVDAQGFHFVLHALEEVNAVRVSYQILNRGLTRGTTDLSIAGSAPDPQRRIWHGSAKLAPDAVIAFDISYTVHGRTYTDDNQRRHFIAPDPSTVLEQRRATASRSSS